MQHVYMHPVFGLHKKLYFLDTGKLSHCIDYWNKVIVSPAVPPGWLSTNSLERLSVQMPFSVDTDKVWSLLVLWQLILAFRTLLQFFKHQSFYLCIFAYFNFSFFCNHFIRIGIWIVKRDYLLFHRILNCRGCTFRQSGRVCVWELAIGLVGLGFTSPELLINPLRLPKLVMPTITTTNTAADAKTGFITGRAL